MPSLYIHIPFCEHKCIYCDFYSIAPNGASSRLELPIGRFLDGLRREIELRAQEEKFRVPYETVFFGGGTPSLLSSEELGSILGRIAASFVLEPGAEITIETNPGTVNLEKFNAFRSLGINRVSIGVQSFHDDDLRFLTRIHSSDQAKQCVRDARSAGIENVSIDLIFSLPLQTKDRWRSNLDQAMELNPSHISCYSLIVEPNTPLSEMIEARQISPLNIEEDAALYEMTISYLADNGYEQYEVSNFARPGFKSRHNMNYWNHANYLGFGPSAHSFWSTGSKEGRPERWWNAASVTSYCEKLEKGCLPLSGKEHLALEQLLEEEIFLGLRSEGIDIAGLRSRYGKDLMVEHHSRLADLIENRMAVVDNGKLRLTARGYLLCDEICSSLPV